MPLSISLYRLSMFIGSFYLTLSLKFSDSKLLILNLHLSHTLGQKNQQIVTKFGIDCMLCFTKFNSVLNSLVSCMNMFIIFKVLLKKYLRPEYDKKKMS